MKLAKLAIFLLLPILACNSTVGCPDASDRAVLSKMYSEFSGMPNYLSVWLSGNYDPNAWNPQFDQWQLKLDNTRKMARGITDRCTRNSYLGWIDYYQGELNSARRELRTKSEKNEMDDFNRRLKREEEASKEYQRTHDIPSPR